MGKQPEQSTKVWRFLKSWDLSFFFMWDRVEHACVTDQLRAVLGFTQFVIALTYLIGNGISMIVKKPLRA